MPRVRLIRPDSSFGLLPELSNTATAVTIGNFDGCHLGHQELIRKTCYFSENNRPKLTPAALTFQPRPKEFFNPSGTKDSLFTEEQKTAAFGELGLKIHFVQDFTAGFARQSPETFKDKYLQTLLRCSQLIIGENFRFGKDREGTAEWLKQSSAMGVYISPSIDVEGEVISSSAIRKALCRGDVEKAARFLGRPYCLEAIVVQGDQLGRNLGFPTANLSDPGSIIPRPGVYAGFASLETSSSLLKIPPAPERALIAVTCKPTIQHRAAATPTVEVHLLDQAAMANDALYAKQLRVYFTHWIRNERKFDNISELTKAMGEDRDQANHLLTNFRI